jgi:DNA-binding XRE family transcriptional regulator
MDPACRWISEECEQMAHNGRSPNRVRELRENRLMTQAQLARKAKVALRTIHSVEKGMNCRMDTKRKILLALGMRFEDKDYVFPQRARSEDPFMHAPPPVTPSSEPSRH